MREKCRVKPKRHTMEGWKAPQPDPPDPFGRTPAQVAQDRALATLDRLGQTYKAKREEERRQRELERARTEPERRRQRLEARRAKARERYREKAAKAAAEPGDDTSQM
jgi:hypothetical protein